jgi:hypothetical protein
MALIYLLLQRYFISGLAEGAIQLTSGEQSMGGLSQDYENSS